MKEWTKAFLSQPEEFDYLVPEDDIDGELPADLCGSLFRNRPGLFERGKIVATLLSIILLILWFIKERRFNCYQLTIPLTVSVLFLCICSCYGRRSRIRPLSGRWRLPHSRYFQEWKGTQSCFLSWLERLRYIDDPMSVLSTIAIWHDVTSSYKMMSYVTCRVRHTSLKNHSFLD